MDSCIPSTQRTGFTLIELSVVLVIIGLIVGGIFVGRDLIAAAETRAQISQIEKYQTAVHTFQIKYGGLPGDLPDPAASAFGFKPRGALPGEGDGNGILTGYDNIGFDQIAGETVMFWVDLSTANLIGDSLSTATSTTLPGNISGSTISQYLPAAKITNNFVYVNSRGWYGDSTNYYSVSAVSSIGSGSSDGMGCSLGCLFSTPGLSVQQAYNIDQKIDDGLPQSGSVTATYMNIYILWAGTVTNPDTPPYTTATAGSATSCFDNSASSTGTPGIAGQPQHYSTEINNGANVNCALSFKFQ